MDKHFSLAMIILIFILSLSRKSKKSFSKRCRCALCRANNNDDPNFSVTKKGAPEWSAKWPPSFACPNANIKTCIYDDFEKAKLDCLAKEECKGIWSRDGKWVNHPGKALYQLTDTHNVTPHHEMITTFYNKTTN